MFMTFTGYLYSSSRSQARRLVACHYARHPEEWPFYWSMTATAVMRLFNERFPASAIKIEPHGNVLAAISLLQGLASEELERAELDHGDPSYPVVIAVRVIKPTEQSSREAWPEPDLPATRPAAVQG